MGVDLQDPVGLEIEGPASVADQMILVLVRPHRNPIEGHLEQVHRGHDVESKGVRAHRGCKPWARLVEAEDDVEGARPDRLQHPVQARQPEAEELAREGEELAQQVEPVEQSVVLRDQGLARLEPDRLDAPGRQRHQHRVAEASR